MRKNTRDFHKIKSFINVFPKQLYCEVTKEGIQYYRFLIEKY